MVTGMAKNVKLFIDDVRMPSDVGYKDSDFIIAREPVAARYNIHHFKPQFIAFDHDLGERFGGGMNQSGYDIAKWMISQELDGREEYITKDFKFSVHSANPVGKKNIEDLLNNYIKNKFG